MKSTAYAAINVGTQHLQLEKLLTSENSVKPLRESESILQYCSTVPLGLHRSGASANICTIIGKMPSDPTKCDKPEPKLNKSGKIEGRNQCACRCKSLATLINCARSPGYICRITALSSRPSTVRVSCSFFIGMASRQLSANVALLVLIE